MRHCGIHLGRFGSQAVFADQFIAQTDEMFWLSSLTSPLVLDGRRRAVDQCADALDKVRSAILNHLHPEALILPPTLVVPSVEALSVPWRSALIGGAREAFGVGFRIEPAFLAVAAYHNAQYAFPPDRGLLIADAGASALELTLLLTRGDGTFELVVPPQRMVSLGGEWRSRQLSAEATQLALPDAIESLCQQADIRTDDLLAIACGGGALEMIRPHLEALPCRILLPNCPPGEVAARGAALLTQPGTLVFPRAENAPYAPVHERFSELQTHLLQRWSAARTGINGDGNLHFVDTAGFSGIGRAEGNGVLLSLRAPEPLPVGSEPFLATLQAELTGLTLEVGLDQRLRLNKQVSAPTTAALLDALDQLVEAAQDITHRLNDGPRRKRILAGQPPRRRT